MSRLFVRGLPEKISENGLKQHFTKCGTVTDIFLLKNKEGKFKRCAIVGYENEDVAATALQYFDKTFINTSRIAVEKCLGDREKKKKFNWNKKTRNELKEIDKKKGLKPNDVHIRLKCLHEIIGKELIESVEFEEFLYEYDKSEELVKLKEELTKVNENCETKSEDFDEKTFNGKTTSLSSDDINLLCETGRLFIRNLSFNTKEEDLQRLFEEYGNLSEVKIPFDTFIQKPKGFGYVTFMFSHNAIKAYEGLNRKDFKGRVIYLHPAQATKKTPEEIGRIHSTGKSFQQKNKIEKKKENSTSYSWNTLFLNSNLIAEATAKELGVSKEELLLPNTKEDLGIRLSLAEAKIVKETKDFLEEKGVDVDSLINMNEKVERSKTVFLVKNIPPQATRLSLFEKLSGICHEKILNKMGDKGKVWKELTTEKLSSQNDRHSFFSPPEKLILPEHGCCAIVEFKDEQLAKRSFLRNSYSNFHDSLILLEWAPIGLLNEPKNHKEICCTKEKALIEKTHSELFNKKETEKEMANEETLIENVKDDLDIASKRLLVKNLPYKTTEDDLRSLFGVYGKLKEVVVAKELKSQVNETGDTLRKLQSIGYAFVHFNTKEEALDAIKSLQDKEIDKFKMKIEYSATKSNENNNSEDDFKKRRKLVKIGRKEGCKKICVRNIPFQANSQEIRSLFETFGKLVSVRLPAKLTGNIQLERSQDNRNEHRGFGFVEFADVNSSIQAFELIAPSTHLYGRRLVLEWANADEENLEIIRKRTNFPSNHSSKKNRRMMSKDLKFVTE
ncbi:hypothetical protein SNEBB_007774 [Seison nebaliae]|nr:hypothetical protein SNEBB_007774 [Seison nebaliae]